MITKKYRFYTFFEISNIWVVNLYFLTQILKKNYKTINITPERVQDNICPSFNDFTYYFEYIFIIIIWELSQLEICRPPLPLLPQEETFPFFVQIVALCYEKSIFILSYDGFCSQFSSVFTDQKWKENVSNDAQCSKTDI